MNTTTTYTPKNIAVKLKPAAEKMAKSGHPWIFDSGIDHMKKDPLPGDLAVIFDRKSDKFVGVGLLDPSSPIRIKMLHVGKSVKINEDWFRDKIAKAHGIRQPLLATDTNSYRLLFGENDGLPGFIFDVYANVGVVKLYSEAWLPYFEMLIKLIREQLPDLSAVVLRLARNIQKSLLVVDPHLHDGKIVWGKLDEEVVIFKEHGVRFSANVIKGHKTGYFLDHRANRHKVGKLATGKTMLDVFSYSGGFSTHAIANNAKEVTSIDISMQALEAAKFNAGLNPSDTRHICIAQDAFVAMETLLGQQKKYDIVVIDPPSFASQKADIPAAVKSYQKLNQLAIRLVKSGGILVSASCSSRIDKEQFYTIVAKAIENSGRSNQCMAKTDHDLDHRISFPEGAYLKTVYYRLN